MIEQVMKRTEDKMQGSIEALKRELASIRTGRASPALIEHLKVDYSGVPTPLNQIAGISAPEPRLLVIQPWDRGSLNTIEKAVLKSDLGLHPSSDGNVIRINIPPLSEERRKDLVKVVRRLVEERRVAIRNLRRDAMEELKESEKNKLISQDENKRALSQLQILTNSSIASVEKTGQDKETELAQV